MTKILGQHRRTFGNFEIIDFADEADLDRVRGKLSVSSETEVRWNHWDYGSEVQELRRLYEKGKKAQWNATDDLDWTIRVSKDDWIANPENTLLGSILGLMGADEATRKAAVFDEAAWLLSQLLHGEQAALQI